MAKRHLETALKVGRNVFTELEHKYNPDDTRPVSHVTVFRHQPVHSLAVQDDSSSSGHSDGIFSCTFAATKDLLAVGCGSSALRVISTSTWQEEWKNISSNKSHMPVMAARFVPCDETRVAFAGADGSLAVCDVSDTISRQESLTTSSALWRADEPGNETYALDVNASGTRIVTAGKDGRIRLYDSETGIVVQAMDSVAQVEGGGALAKGHGRAVFSARYVEGDELFVTAGWDPYGLLWDPRTPVGTVAYIQGPLHVCGDALDIRHCHLLVGSWRLDDALQLWDLRTLAVVKSFRGLAWLYSTRFAAADTIVAGGSCSGGSADVIRTCGETVGTVCRDERPVQCIAVGKRGRVVCAAGQSGTLTLASLAS